MAEKRCLYCKHSKPPEDFYRDRSRKDGVSNGCKACILAERARYRQKHREQLKLQARHDRRRVPERGCWQQMQRRCYNPAHPYYACYGGRGIRVCERWRTSFQAFLADMGPRPSLAHTVDRIDANGHYEPSNCRWATPSQQARNMRTSRRITWRGTTQSMADWADELNIPAGSIRDRLRLGWSVEQALGTPRLAKGKKPPHWVAPRRRVA